MRLFGKIISSTEIEYAQVNYNNILNFNTNEELMRSYGFKPVTDTARPSYDEVYQIGTWIWEEINDEIVKTWTVTYIDIDKAKDIKKTENTEKMHTSRASHEFTITLQEEACSFDTSERTQNDLNSAMNAAIAGQPWQWTTNNKVKIYLQVEDINAVNAKSQELVSLDISKWSNYEDQIDAAETTEAVKAIIIDYSGTDNSDE